MVVQHGVPPYLEASTKGDKRFSPFCAKVNGKTIEEQYQAAKIFENGETGVTWKRAKFLKQRGYSITNYEECNTLFTKLFVQYIWGRPDLEEVLVKATGISDIFGQPGSPCQADVLWHYRNDVRKNNNVLLVTGGRDYDDKKRVFKFLDKINARKPIHLLIEGGASGADRLCQMWAKSRHVRLLTKEAEWDTYGKGAGLIRNKEMLDLLLQYKHRWLAAFPGGKGTAHMVKLSQKKGVKVLKCNTNKWGSK